MQRKSYVIVTDAQRQVMTTNRGAYRTLQFEPKVERKTYDHRKEELGILHPDIVDFFKNFSPKKPGRGIMSEIFGFERGDSIYTLGNGIGNKEEFPILMYDENLSIPKGEGYFIVPLVESEFVKLRGRTFDYIKNKIAGWGEKEDWVAACREVGLEDWVEDQYRHLEVFETLMKGRYDQIPVERTKRHVSDEEIKLELGFIKELRRLKFQEARTRFFPGRV